MKTLSGEIEMVNPPFSELSEIMQKAYNPCGKFDLVKQGSKYNNLERAESSVCVADWNPKEGYIPRGFIGATGDKTDVEAVLICIKPDKPHANEKYSPDLKSKKMFKKL